MITDTTIRINDEENPTKLRKITIYKREVYEDVELFTYKHVEGSQIEGAERRNAVSADTTEALDGRIIVRLVGFRDAQLRKLMPFAMAKKSDFGADDVMTLEDDRFHYWLKLPEDFDAQLASRWSGAAAESLSIHLRPQPKSGWPAVELRFAAASACSPSG